MIQRIYIDTSVIGGCFDIEFKEWSNLLFEEFRKGKKIAIISDITLYELEEARSEVRKHIQSIPAKFVMYLTIDNETPKNLPKCILKKEPFQENLMKMLFILQ